MFDHIHIHSMNTDVLESGTRHCPAPTTDPNNNEGCLVDATARLKCRSTDDESSQFGEMKWQENMSKGFSCTTQITHIWHVYYTCCKIHPNVGNKTVLVHSINYPICSMHGIFTYIWVILFGSMLVNIPEPWSMWDGLDTMCRIPMALFVEWWAQHAQ